MRAAAALFLSDFMRVLPALLPLLVLSTVLGQMLDLRTSASAPIVMATILGGVFGAVHGAIALYHYRVGELSWVFRQLFDVDQENNLPSWFSGFLLLVTSAFLWVCARDKRARGDVWSRHWYVLAVGFLLMSVDEIAGVHESINTVIVMTWAIPGAILAFFIGLTFVPFLLALPRDTAVRFAIAGGIYLAGATGLEVIGNNLVAANQQDTLHYHMWSLAEEGLELFGVLFFLRTLLVSMRGPGSEAIGATVDLG